jgi:hypothetical protein
LAVGKPLHAHQRALVAENGKDRNQEHPTLWKEDAASHAAIWHALEQADQIGCSEIALKQSNHGGGKRDGRTKPHALKDVVAFWNTSNDP